MNTLLQISNPTVVNTVPKQVSFVFLVSFAYPMPHDGKGGDGFKHFLQTTFRAVRTSSRVRT